MKKTIILLFILLPLFSDYLFAQSQEGLFRLKEGDWFEVQAERNGADYLLRYLLQNQSSNGNQQYEITLEHFKIIWSPPKDSKIFGYDSYYPEFENNIPFPASQIRYTMEVSPRGKILKHIPFKENRSSEVVLKEMGSSYLQIGSSTYTRSMDDFFAIEELSKALTLPVKSVTDKSIRNKTETFMPEGNIAVIKDSLQNKILYQKDCGVPLFGKLGQMQFVLTGASFPATDNTIIQGKIKDQANQAIIVSLEDESVIPDNRIPERSSYFTKREYKTKADGSFICPIFLNRPLHLKVQVGDRMLTTFLEPTDTLNIIEEADKKLTYQEPFGFTGNAAFNTMLSNEIDSFRKHFSKNDSVQSFINDNNNKIKAVNKLLESYKGKASQVCIEYFQKDMMYYLAAEKLRFDEEVKQMPLEKLREYFKTHQKFPKINYPNDFFLEVDTLPILMNPFEYNTSYLDYIDRSQRFKQIQLGNASGKRFSDNFNEHYFFTQASLRGYPLYQQIAQLLDQEFRKGLSQDDILQSYFEDFINNCEDPALVDPLKRVYETALQMKIGRRFPVNSVAKNDSTIFNLGKFKGKPVCLILLNGPKSSIKGYKDEMAKFSPEEVEFVFVRSSTQWQEDEQDTTLLKKPNVSYIEVPEKYLTSTLLLGNMNKIIMLDKWFRIVENNAEDPLYHKYKGGVSGFEKSLRKTIEARRYTKSEKTAMLKIAGWSFGSILFTLLIGIWIYRIRIRRIKQQETIKRRIKELEIKAIRSQMNPHFIFNALNSIQSLINRNQYKEANIYLSKFAVLLRGVLNNSEKTMVSLSDELQRVELYCQLEQLRFDFKFEINIAPEVNEQLIEIPGMIIQPLAENAIVHGLSSKGIEGKLDIRLERQNGDLCVLVSDNGIGLTKTQSDQLRQKGFGLKLVEERINILNLDGKQAKLSVKNNSDTDGTIAKLTIPID